jgi:hypothetical protein
MALQRSDHALEVLVAMNPADRSGQLLALAR